MKFPLVTIVTVTLDCEAFVERTLKSVLSQTYPAIEFILVDGVSTDGTLTILKRYAEQFAHFISEKDNGIYDAMNKGKRLASPDSKYIMFLNAGDVFVDTCVLNDVINSAQSPEANLYGRVLKRDKVIETPDKLNSFTLATGMVCHQACFFQTETHRKYLYDSKFTICADYKLLLELIKAGEEFEKIEKTIAKIDISGISHTQRSLLFNEKRKIRKQYPKVYFYYILKRVLRRFRKVGP